MQGLVIYGSLQLLDCENYLLLSLPPSHLHNFNYFYFTKAVPASLCYYVFWNNEHNHQFLNRVLVACLYIEGLEIKESLSAFSLHIYLPVNKQTSDVLLLPKDGLQQGKLESVGFNFLPPRYI